MPPQPQGQETQKRVSQVDDRKYIIFRQFETMDTQSNRVALQPNRLAWLENLQPVGPNDLIAVPGPNSPIANIFGETVSKYFSGNLNGVDYVFAFCVSGAAYQVRITDGNLTKFANAGTFTNPDMTQWQSSRVLIADPTAGYATWDGTVLVVPGGVSPNINITNGGSGYGSGANVSITGGSGVGATATATVVSGVVSSITLTNSGTGYKAGDVLTVNITPVAGGAGATANARIWPILTFTMYTVAVFQGRVWLAGGRNYFWTGTAGYDDTNPSNASGSSVLVDADLPHSITALRSLNNFLYFFGDGSLKQIGSIAVSGSVTVFTITTLSSDQGTTFPQSIASYNRLILFANFVGVWAIFGATVEKISDPMDGVFRSLDFSLSPVACPNDINNIRCYLLMARYVDPINGPRTIFMTFMNKKWFIVSQGAGIRAACTSSLNGTLETFVSSGSDVTQILQSLNTAVPITLRTSLSDDGKPMLGKRGIRIGIAQQYNAIGTMLLTTDSENSSATDQYTISFPVTFVNNSGQIVTFVNNASQVVTFQSAGFYFQDKQFKSSGIYLGASLNGNFANFHLNGIVIEYVAAALMRSKNSK
jgi:hypothetical protein